MAAMLTSNRKTIKAFSENLNLHLTYNKILGYMVILILIVFLG